MCLSLLVFTQLFTEGKGEEGNIQRGERRGGEAILLAKVWQRA